MAKIEAELYGNFDIILMDLHNTVMRGSTSASLEESSDIVVGHPMRHPCIRALQLSRQWQSEYERHTVPDGRQNIRFGNFNRRQSGGIL